jgi:hypothetical protein
MIPFFVDHNLMINYLLHSTFHLPVRTRRAALNLLAACGAL